MAALSATLRSTFEREVIRARDTAEEAAQAALATLAVEQDRPFESMGEEKRALRRALRARARQLGEGDMDAGLPRLVEEIAYEQWHRMLFARFLAENELLMHPQGVAVTLEECAELAQEEGAEDLWAVATRYASLMLPGIFRIDDPALQVRFAPEKRHRLEQIVSDLPRAVFTSDDGLGWAYQFWQSKKKDEVNASERKIGGADIAPVTQLFTEDYMVKFLLHNTLGAWWAHRHPDSLLNKSFEYLRYRDDGTPAAGTFDGWPDRVAEVTMMDPCGGSGHFIVAAFEMFYRMRMEEERLSAAAAGDAVICDNVHMLEIDLRCTQIASFSLAMAAWKTGGYRALPTANIACSGIPVRGQLEEWVELAGKQTSLRWALERLYHLFRAAPDLGSLINPAQIPDSERFLIERADRIQVLLQNAMQQETASPFSTLATARNAAADVARAAPLLARTYTLVATNVPYLTQVKLSDQLKGFSEDYHENAKADLATVFLERCRDFAVPGGTYAVVTPQNWLFLGLYESMRRSFLEEQQWNHVSWLGPGAFDTISGEVVKPVLIIISNKPASGNHEMTGIDAAQAKSGSGKAHILQTAFVNQIAQFQQFDNPDARITLVARSAGRLLGTYADSYQGICTGDYPRFGRDFWEMPYPLPGWIFQQSTVKTTEPYSGRQNVLLWQNGTGALHNFLVQRLGASGLGAWIRGLEAWGKRGVCINQMSSLYASLYTGDCFDNNVAVIVPKDESLLPAIWAFCASPEFHKAVRRIDRKLNVTNKTLLKVPFDLERWRQVADENGPLPGFRLKRSNTMDLLWKPKTLNSCIAGCHIASSWICVAGPATRQCTVTSRHGWNRMFTVSCWRARRNREIANAASTFIPR